MTKYTNGQFLHDMKCGLGRTIVELDRRLRLGESIEPYRNAVLYGCKHTLSFDTQVEGTRAEYLYELQMKFPDHEIFERTIISNFNKNRSNGDWVFSQFCEMLFLYAKDGNLASKKALYDKYMHLYDSLKARRSFKKNRTFPERDDFETLCITLTSLDGFSALIRIVKAMGTLILTNKLFNCDDFEWFYVDAKDKFGKKRVEQYLEKHAKTSEAIKVFYDIKKKHENEVQTTKANRKDPELQSAKEIIDAAERSSADRSPIRQWKFARDANEEQKLLLAEAAIKEQDPEKKAFLLKAFVRKYAPFPLDFSSIIEYTKSENEPLQFTAFWVLEQIKDVKLHDFAVDLLQKREHVSEAISILAKNFQKSDKDLLVSAVKSLSVTRDDESHWHEACMSVRELFDVKNANAPTELLTYFYENSLCSFCRYQIVKIMSRRRMLTPELLLECFYDSEKEIRIFAKRKRKKQGVCQFPQEHLNR